MALPPDNMSSVRVVSTMNIETLVQDVSDVSSSTWEESHLNVLTGAVWKYDSVVAVIVEVSGVLLNRDGSVSVSKGSDSSGSPVKDPPLSVVSWVVVLDSESILV
jgi:hypothetical protein